MRYFIKIAFNGKNYNGWQIQGDSPTVQKTLNNALSIIYKEEIQTTGAGRTDTGVHASEFFAHFDSELSTPDSGLIYRLNGILPKDIKVFDIFPVREDAHARYSAISRTYKYYISRNKDPFYNEYAYYLYGKLDIDKMNEAAQLLFNYNDFTSFAKLHTNTKTNNCKIIHAEWKSNDQRSTINDKLIFTITADRFLRNMVRAIVGTLLDVGRGKLTIEKYKQVIDSKNRSNAGYSVPAHALFLTKIEYPEDIFLE